MVGHPSASHPSSGEVDIILSFSPLSSGKYNVLGHVVNSSDEVGLAGGPESAKTASAYSASDTQVIESYVRRTVLSSVVVDYNDLCIVKGKAAWKVVLNCVVLNNDGNVVDAAILGCVAALRNLRLPMTKTELVKDSGESLVVQVIDDLEKENDACTKRKGTPLTLRSIPVPLTVGMFKGKMLIDPTLEEEAVCDGTVTVVVDAASLNDNDEGSNSDGIVLSLQKNGTAMASADKLITCIQLSFDRAREMKSRLT